MKKTSLHIPEYVGKMIVKWKTRILMQRPVFFLRNCHPGDALSFSLTWTHTREEYLQITLPGSCKFGDRLLQNYVQIWRETRTGLKRKPSKSCMTLTSATSPIEKRKTLLHRGCYNKCVCDPSKYFSQKERRMGKAESIHTNQSF